jgi:YVTN family beta-propeller protein
MFDPKNFAAAFACTALLSIPLAGVAKQPPAYATSQTVAVGAPDRWDYLTLDPAAQRLYLAHGDRVDVLDSKNGNMLGSVTGTEGGSHGIGIVGSVGKGYTDDGRAGEVIVFDLKSFKTIKRVKAEVDADGITVDPKTQHVLVVDGDSGLVTVIDPRTDGVIETVNVGGGLEFAVADGRGKVYVNGAERREIVRIDTATNRVDARWPIPGCESPHGLAIDVQSGRLFVSCLNQVLTVVSTQSGAVVASLPIGRGTDGAAFDPRRHLVFSANGADGTISVIQQIEPDKYVAGGDIKTAVTGRTMTIDPATGRLYLAAASIDPAAPIKPGANGRPGRPVPLPGSLKVYFLDPQDVH